MRQRKTFTGEKRGQAEQKADEWIAAHPNIEVLSKTRPMQLLNPIDGPAIFEVIVEYELPVVPAGWVVELRTPITAGELPIVELWDAAIADRNEALEKVCKRPQAIDAIATIIKPLSKAMLDDQGLKAGEIRLRKSRRRRRRPG